MPCLMDRSTHPIVQAWLKSLSDRQHANSNDSPGYYLQDPTELISTCVPTTLTLGTGEQLLTHALFAARQATSSVILVTCFWARAPSQKLIVDLLYHLSSKATSIQGSPRIRVRICFSSLSLLQKLFHSQSLDGKIWDPATWPTHFGLPAQADIPGVDLKIKSIFVKPFSVMHPKFIIIDSETAFLPSCNVSWEKWFEGCLGFRGPAVKVLQKFYHEFWRMNLHEIARPQLENLAMPSEDLDTVEEISDCLFSTKLAPAHISAILLPSSHHCNPRFRPWPLLPRDPPTTPLNQFLTTAIGNAHSSIFIQTPNLTCAAVITALLEALERGVDIHVTTSSRLMVLEQIITAGTTTEWCVRSLKRRYLTLLQKQSRRTQVQDDVDLEALRVSDGNGKIGILTVHWYRSKQNGDVDEPVKSHLKLCVIDKETTVLGSGNLDRASWFTSQELGVALVDKSFAGLMLDSLRTAMTDRSVT